LKFGKKKRKNGKAGNEPGHSSIKAYYPGTGMFSMFVMYKTTEKCEK